jgi:hypothetical protein
MIQTNAMLCLYNYRGREIETNSISENPTYLNWRILTADESNSNLGRDRFLASLVLNPDHDTENKSTVVVVLWLGKRLEDLLILGD